MKKFIAAGMAAAIALSLAACGGTSGGQSQGPASDTSGSEPQVIETAMPETEEPAITAPHVFGMTFGEPEGYEEKQFYVERLAADDSISEVTQSYVLSEEDAKGYSFSCARGLDLSEAQAFDPEELTEKVVGDLTFQIYESEGGSYAFYQQGPDLYGIQIAGADEAEADEVLSGIAILPEGSEPDIDEKIEGVEYTIGNESPLYSHVFTFNEDPEGNVTEMTEMLKFGASMDEIDYRFVVRMYPNTTIEELKEESSEYAETEVNGIAYTYEVPYDEEEAPYNYYTQQGGNVYQVRNNGAYNGLWTTRSEESVPAFEAFLNSVHFN